MLAWCTAAKLRNPVLGPSTDRKEFTMQAFPTRLPRNAIGIVHAITEALATVPRRQPPKGTIVGLPASAGDDFAPAAALRTAERPVPYPYY
jgi:hypothetical protein